LFGIWENSKHSQIYTIHFILLMTKYHAHKCKFCKKKKKLILLHSGNKFSIISIHSDEAKTIKTLKICNYFNTYKLAIAP